MAKYQKYAEYKDSGVEWLGEIPGHWDSKPLKYLCTYNDEVLSETTYKEAEIQYIDIGSVSAVDGISKIETMIFKDAPSRARRIVRDGDVIVSTVRTYLEAIAPINNPPENLIVSTGFAVIRPNQYLYKSFASYCLRAKGFIKEVVARSVGVSYPAINSSDLVNITIPSIGYVEQVKIANFLDHETAKIDSLIAKQEKLIELLKEKHQAVISHVVTKGLNPNVAMKDSGVEWLGQVPEHWKVMQFRRITSLSQGLQIPQSERLHEPNDNTVEYITIKSLNAKDDAYKEYIYKASDRVTCGKSDVLLARTGATGEVVTNVSGAFHNNFFKVSYSNDILRDFLVYILKVKELKSHLLMLAGTTTIPDLNHGAFLGTQIALPSLTEQQEIIDFIDDYLRRSMILEGKARSAIQLMQERRTALISSAVTGKIDVRNWQNPNEAKTEFSA